MGRLTIKEKLMMQYALKSDRELICLSNIIKNKSKNLLKMRQNKFMTVYNKTDSVTFCYFESDESEKQLFVKPKYENLREELLHYLNKKHFDDLLISATLHFESDHYVLYTQKVSDMTKEHLLAMIVYCNNFVQCKLKETYFRLNTEETNESIKQRHAAFAHFCCLLQQIVNDYGIQCNSNKL